MNPFGWLCMALVLVGVLHADDTVYRVVHGQVIGLDGKPVAGRTIHLVGLSRSSINPFNDDGKRSPNAGWDFVTDKEGGFHIRFGGYRTGDRLDDSPPGWGTYVVIVDGSADDAGCVSKTIYHTEDAATATLQSQDQDKILRLLPEGLKLDLSVTKGALFEGRIWDYSHPSQPLKGVRVAIDNDMHAETHTGWGGEVFRRETTTDSEGHFRFPRVQRAEPSCFA